MSKVTLRTNLLNQLRGRVTKSQRHGARGGCPADQERIEGPELPATMTRMARTERPESRRPAAIDLAGAFDSSLCIRTGTAFGYQSPRLPAATATADREAKAFIQVDDKLEFCGLLNRQIGWLRALENLVNEARCAAPMPRVG